MAMPVWGSVCVCARRGEGYLSWMTPSATSDAPMPVLND